MNVFTSIITADLQKKPFGIVQVYAVIGSSVLGTTLHLFEGSVSNFNLFPSALDRDDVMSFFQSDHQIHSFGKAGNEVVFGWWDFKGRAMSPGSEEIHLSHHD